MATKTKAKRTSRQPGLRKGKIRIAKDFSQTDEQTPSDFEHGGAKRDLFSELCEGIEALRQQRLGKITLRQQTIRKRP